MYLPKRLKVTLGFSIAGIILLIGILIFMFVFQDAVITSIIKSSVVLRDGSTVWSRFVTLPFPFHFKGYFFHIINAEDVLLNGDTPIVNEVGPYHFNEYRNKTIYENSVENTISYREELLFEFDQELSNGLSLDTRVTVINPPFFGILSSLESININLPFDLEGGVRSMFDEPYVFFNATVRQLMFDGVTICDPSKTDSIGKFLCLILMLVRQKNMIYNDDLSISFSFVGYKNNTNDGLYVVDSGEGDISKVGSILTWENSSYTNYWLGNQSDCNKVEGTRTTVFPPFLETDSAFNVYSTDICKSAHITYNKRSTYSGIEGYRFKTYLNSFTSEDDDCYCVADGKDLNGNDTCFANGILNLYTCQAAPVLLTFPHFLWLDESLRTVEGLNASEEKHETFVDIDPYLGIPLRSTQKVQFNVILRPYFLGNGRVITITQNLTRALTPMFWIDEGMQLTPDITDEIKSSLYDRLTLLNVLEYVIIALSVALILIPSAYCLFVKLRKQPDPTKIPEQNNTERVKK